MAPPSVSGARRLSILFRQAREPVFVLDGQRRFLYANPAWEELTGVESRAVVGRECLPRGLTNEEENDLARLLDGFCPPPEALQGHPAGGTTLIVRVGGERIWRRVEFWPYHDPRGVLIGLLGLIREGDAMPHAPDSDSQRLRTELLEVRDRLRGRYGIDNLVGHGPHHRRVLEQVRAAAVTSVPVLVLGETGTGRRTVARTIHMHDRAAPPSLVPFDCAALPPEVLERELFGAGKRTAGGSEGGGSPPRLDLPAGAAVLLLEVTELHRDLQARLVEMIAEDRARVLATTSVDPDQSRSRDRLRHDLYYALTTLVIRLNPLRQRLDELSLLAQHMLDRANQRHDDRRRVGFDRDALAALAAYDWPGNLRELDRVVDFARGRADADLIHVSDLPAAIRGHLGAAYLPPPSPPSRTPLDATLTQVERRLIEHALKQARQNKSRAAELLDISRPRLYRRIKELNIPDEPEASDGTPQTTESGPEE